MNPESPTAGPFSHQGNSVQRTMLLVLLALLPATLFGFYLYGWPALFLFLVTVFSALLAEAFALKLAGKPVSPYLFDGSALLTAWLLAMSLPPWAPWWIAVLGSLLAIIVGKQIFGGLGQNLFNPAMVARVALLISFPVEMTQFPPPTPLFSESAPGLLESLAITFGHSAQVDALSGATALGFVKTELGRGLPLSQITQDSSSVSQLFWGTVPGSLGEVSTVLLFLGGLFLIYKQVISWHIPVSMLTTLFFLAAVFHAINPEAYPGPLWHLLSGAAVLGAFFIATDLVTSPVSARGQLIFGVGCGALVYVIRTWAAYPEGVAFAVMLMNSCTPLIDHYIKPRVYGRDRKGEPLSYSDKEGSA